MPDCSGVWHFQSNSYSGIGLLVGLAPGVKKQRKYCFFKHFQTPSLDRKALVAVNLSFITPGWDVLTRGGYL